MQTERWYQIIGREKIDVGNDSEPNWVQMGRGKKRGIKSAFSLIDAPLATRSPARQEGETGDDLEFRGKNFISIRTIKKTGPVWKGTCQESGKA